ncbi:hypothetical protein [Treponema parvum]|uniref:hypothetical protein n=1 Tax=Treponema parvum TaxID=138851 RepID=UPI001AEC2016|nr:hypothetical protein [Treponema parvum]QTQ15537.1 hypothetical protein HXT04_01780 [Treponema parvum]
MENTIMSEQFVHNMAPWLNEKTESVIKSLLNIQGILISDYRDRTHIEELFTSHSFIENIKEDTHETIIDWLAYSFYDLTKILSFTLGGKWDIEDRDLLENQGMKGLKKLCKKYGLKQQAHIQISNKILSNQFECNMAHWLYERVVSVIEKLLEIQKFFVVNRDKQNIEELLTSPYTDSKTNNDHILDLISDSFFELTHILSFTVGGTWDPQDKDLLIIRGEKGLDKLYVKYGLKEETDIHREIFSFIRKARELLKGERAPNRTFLYDILYPIVKEDPLLQHIDDNLELVRDGEMTWEAFVDKTVIDLNRLEKLYENE